MDKTIRRKTVKQLLGGESAPTGSTVDVKGWVRTRRGNKHVQFVALNDGTTVGGIQVVFDLSRFSEEQLKAVATGAAIRGTQRRLHHKEHPDSVRPGKVL